MPPKERIILGIDPGLALVGYGLIKQQGQQNSCLAYGCITTEIKDDSLRLEQIYQELQVLITKYQPTLAVVEKLYFSKNTKTALAVAQARGVILLTLKKNNLALIEITPLEVKQALTGYGQANKGQIQRMVKLLLKLAAIPKPDDAADALALALYGSNFKQLI
ncbi:MAG: crossover junction endodeoxyribonuclease RuvC [Candidatus Buchananbacteria bacterium]